MTLSPLLVEQRGRHGGMTQPLHRFDQIANASRLGACEVFLDRAPEHLLAQRF